MKKISKEKIKTWFITGASSGIGYGLAKELLLQGYNVIAVARHIPDFNHENVLCLSCDVTKPKDVKSAIDEGINRFGRIDVVFNNAGITSKIFFEDTTLEHIKQVMEINFYGTFNVIHAILPHFRINKNGTIINNSSMHGIAPRLYGSSYAASKHAIEGLTGVLRLETVRFCRVASIELGYIPGTNIDKNVTPKEPQIKEYKNLPEYCKIWGNYINDLTRLVPYLIGEIEKEKLPRHLILGRDACKKVNVKIKELKNDYKFALKNANKYSKFDKNFPKRVINKVFKVLFKKQIYKTNIL